MEITKAIIPIAGLGTRFLPVSKVVPKEVIPLVDKPLIQYSVEELKNSGIKEIIFVVNSNKKFIEDYFRKSPKLEKLLEERGQEDLLEELRSQEKLTEGMTFSYVSDKPMGDGHAVLAAKKLVGEEACLVVYPDDVIDSETPCSQQLMQVFKTAQKPVLALCELSSAKLPFYGVVGVEKIARRFYKIKKLVEKPPAAQAPSNFVRVGRAVLTPEVFQYLKKAKPNKKGEVVLAEVLATMMEDGKIIYGYEIEGKWLECGDKARWLFSNVYFSLKHPQLGKTMQELLKEEKLI